MEIIITTFIGGVVCGLAIAYGLIRKKYWYIGKDKGPKG